MIDWYSFWIGFCSVHFFGLVLYFLLRIIRYLNRFEAFKDFLKPEYTFSVGTEISLVDIASNFENAKSKRSHGHNNSVVDH